MTKSITLDEFIGKVVIMTSNKYLIPGPEGYPMEVDFPRACYWQDALSAAKWLKIFHKEYPIAIIALVESIQGRLIDQTDALTDLLNYEKELAELNAKYGRI